MKILLLSYSFGAHRGSEAGVGWNVAKGLAERGHEVAVVTTTEFAEINHQAIRESSLPIRLIELDEGVRSFASSGSYHRWQRRVQRDLRQLCSREVFDLAHHVTFNQYRGIRDVFATGLPYVIGPIGGAETVSWRLLAELPVAMAIKEVLRYVPYDVKALAQSIRTSECPGKVLASTPQTQERLSKVGGIGGVELYPIIAVHASDVRETPPVPAEIPYLVFDGGARPEKGLRLLLRVYGRLWQDGLGMPLRVAAIREELRWEVQTYAARCGLPREALELMPFMPRSQLMEIMGQARGFISVGFRDAGCMALLEALALGIPCLCLDISGQHWLPSELARKVPVDAQLENRLQQELAAMIAAPPLDSAWHARRAAWLRGHMTWDVRIQHLEEVYRSVLQQGGRLTTGEITN